MITLVENLSGALVDFEASIPFMDDYIREMVHSMGDYKTDEEAHALLKKEPWKLSKANPTY
jgi:hypothetical protein|nr:MAG TPA: hypothetical protein [Bacteriophage sp.]